MIEVEVGEERYQLDPQPVRTSLSDTPAMLWGFQVQVLQDGRQLGIKTCFVGRVSVQARAPEALDAPIDRLAPVLHELAVERIRARLEAGETGDEIVFA